jgi:branched-chain amino acid transport system substrate-binding protein
MAPVAKQYRKVFFADGGVADEITGSGWNRFVFRVSRSAGQDAIANARAIAKKGTSVATLAFDYSAGRSTIDALRAALKVIGANLVDEEYAAADSIDFTAPGLKLFEALSKVDGDRVIWVNWYGPVNPVPQLKRMSVGYPGIRLATYGNTFSYMKAFKGLPDMEGATSYYYELPKNPVNDWLVKEHHARYGNPPDLFEASAFSTAIAIIEGMKKAGGDPSSARLIPALEGMSFDTPKGEMVLRKEDHQAMQDMYHFKTKVVPDVDWGVPELVRVIPKEELNLPILVKSTP